MPTLVTNTTASQTFQLPPPYVASGPVGPLSSVVVSAEPPAVRAAFDVAGGVPNGLALSFSPPTPSTANVGDPRTVPAAYPYTTLDSDRIVAVDTSAQRTILLGDGTTAVQTVIEDAGDNADAQNITIGVANTAKKLNGSTNGTLTVSTKGALRGFSRDASGNWRGGV